MKKSFLIVLFALCFTLTPISVLAQTAEANIKYSDSLYEQNEIAQAPRLTFEYNKDEQSKNSNAPEIGCKAAFLADPESGKIFYEKNAHEKMYPASTTKILTALIVLENCNVEEKVKISQKAVDLIPEGYSNANLKPGEEHTVYTLLQALLIPSANEAAYALAEHVSGSIDAFAELSNKRAKELGCETLHFVNPNGVHDDSHYCSAYDLYIIAKECRKYDVFNEIVKSKSFTVPPTEIYKNNDRKYENTNELLLPSSSCYYSHCTGIKTGHTTPAGECLVSGSSKDGLDLICVVLGGEIKQNGINERFYDSKKLLEYVYENYSYKTFAKKYQSYGKRIIENATKDTSTLDTYILTDIKSLAPNEINAKNVVYETELPEVLEAPIKQNQVLGKVTYRVDGFIYSTNIVASHDVEKKP